MSMFILRYANIKLAGNGIIEAKCDKSHIAEGDDLA